MRHFSDCLFLTDNTKTEKSWEQVKPKAAKKEKVPTVAKDAVREGFFPVFFV